MLNGPIGPAIKITGYLSQNCVPLGKQNNISLCTAQLEDGSFQQFKTVTPASAGDKVVFERRERKYAGRYYGLVSINP
jgi:hypothetical protein